MEIKINSAVNFQRRLKPKEEADYFATLKLAKEKIGNRGKSILIIPTTALPQEVSNNTGLGNIAGKESAMFFDFAKKYWGINEIQIQPIGQYHNHNGTYPIYSGTSLDLGNHVINIKSHCTEEEFQELVKSNNNSNDLNYENIVDKNSKQEKILKRIYKREASNKEFAEFKKNNAQYLEPKALYRALRELNNSYDYKNWNDVDKNLYLLPKKERENRIAEIYKQKSEEIDFYKFKQFLAEKDLKQAKENLNSKGLKLNGDLICGFSFDEIWAHPKAFLEGKTIGWGLPALDLESKDAENLLREKIQLYSKRFDGFRIDASWTYINQPNGKNYNDKILNIIDDEVKKVKGANFDLKNIMHEFTASEENFRLYDGEKLKDCVKNRVQIQTSDWLSENWGSNKAFLERGWNPENFIIGATNHDSKKIKFDKEQAKVLSKILNIPESKLNNEEEFIKAKLAEPMMAYNNMIYFKDALATDKNKLSMDFEKEYIYNLEHNKGFNPMDALEKAFKAKGLDSEELELFNKIVKYKKILENKEFSHKKIAAIAVGVGILGTAVTKMVIDKIIKQHPQNTN